MGGELRLAPAVVSFLEKTRHAEWSTAREASRMGKSGYAPRKAELAGWVVEARELLSNDEAARALTLLIETIEATGGVVPDEEIAGVLVPVADPEWSDLADAYMKACRAIGREPMVDDAREEHG